MTTILTRTDLLKDARTFEGNGNWSMCEDVLDGDAKFESNIDPMFVPSKHDAMLRTTRWQNMGNDDPRLPPAFMIEFSATAFTLSAFERHNVPFPSKLRKAVPKRQAEFLMGRLAARQAVERLGVIASTPGTGPSREPLWQSGVTGSITHTSEMASAVAVLSSTVNGIGIDIEKVIDAGTHDAIWELVITPGEKKLLEMRGKNLSVEMLLAIAFSAKESFFKGTFATVGHYFDFNAVRLSYLNVDCGHATLTLTETLCPALPEGRSFKVCFRELSANTVMTSFVW